MLEGLLANFLNRLLGEYIENFDATQLKVAVWNGDVTLRNLQLKRSAFRKLELPISVQYGLVEELTLKIPWSSLKNKPVEIYIVGIRALASMEENVKSQSEVDPHQVLESKRRQMQLWEASQIGKAETAYDPKTQTFTESLITRMIDNIQINIRDIHIRFEHLPVSNVVPGGYSFGLLLSEFSIESCNEEWTSTFVETESQTIYKLCSLRGFGIYSDETAECIDKTDINELMNTFQALITDFQSREKDYIIAPVTGMAKVTINKLPTPEIPRFLSQISFRGFDVSLNDSQISCGMSLAHELQDVMSKLAFRKRIVGNVSLDTPLDYLRFIFQKTLHDIQQKHYARSWPAIKAFCEKRRNYIKLYKKKFLAVQLSADESKELDVLELNLDISQLKLFRSLAYQEIKNEGFEPQPPKQQGWGSWMWNSFRGASDENGEVTDDQRKTVIDAIGLNDSIIESAHVGDLQSNTSLFDVRLEVPSGKFSLLKYPKKENVISLELLNFFSQFKCNKKDYSFVANLGSLKMYNDDRNFLYPRETSNKEIETTSPSIFTLSFERSSSDDNDTDTLGINLRALEFFYDPNLLLRVKGFQSSLFANDNGRKLVRLANDAVTDFTSQTVQNLQEYLNEKRKLNVNFQFQTPLLIFPEDCNNPESFSLFVDAGFISITSQNVETNDKESNSESETLYHLIYDRYRVSLESARLLLGPLNELKNESNKINEEYYLMNELNTEIFIQAQRVPTPQYPRIKVEGNMPCLSFILSDAQFRILNNLASTMLKDGKASDDDDNGDWRPESSESLDSHESEYKLNNTPSEQSVKVSHFFEFNMKLGEVTLILCREDSQTKRNSMVSVNFAKLLLSFNQFEDNSHLRMSINSFHINDMLSKSSRDNNRQLMRCYAPDSVDAENTPVIVEIKSVKAGENQSETNTTVDFLCANGDFYLAKFSILTLIEFLPSFAPPPSNDKQSTPQVSNSAAGKMELNFKIHKIGLRLLENYESKPICIDLLALDLSVNSTKGISEVESRVDKIQVMAWDHEKDEIVTLIDSKQDSLFDLKCKMQEGWFIHSPNPSTDVNIKMGSFTMLCHKQPIEEILNYASNFGHYKAIVQSVKYLAETGTHQVQQGTNVNINLYISNPIFQIPLTLENGSSAMVEILPGSFSLKTPSWLPNLTLNLESKSTTLRTIYYSKDFDEKGNQITVLDDLNISLDGSIVQAVDSAITNYAIDLHCGISELLIHLSQAQYLILLKLASNLPEMLSIANAFSANVDAPSVMTLLSEELYSIDTVNDAISNLSQNSSFDMKFGLHFPKISLNLYDGTFITPENSLSPLSNFTLNEIRAEGSYDLKTGASALIKMASLAIEDVRSEKSRYFSNVIIPSTDTESQLQVSFQYKPDTSSILLEGDIFKSMYVLSLDHLLSIYYWFGQPLMEKKLESPDDVQSLQAESSVSTPAVTAASEKSISLSVRFDIRNTSLVFVADASKSTSQAIVLRTDQISLVKQLSYSLTVQKMGMFVTRMDKLDDGIQILDDFDIGFGLVQDCSENKSFSATLDLDRLLFRISVYDLLLLQSIAQASVSVISSYKDKSSSISENMNSGDYGQQILNASNIAAVQQKAEQTATTLLTVLGHDSLISEEFTINSAGIQLILISDAHCLPVFDFTIENFNVLVKDWSTNLSATTSLTLHCNAFNFAKSHWEPVIEPWTFSTTAIMKDGMHEVNINSDDIAQISLTPMMVTDVHRLIKFYLTNQENNIEKRPEGYPYVILNQTGYNLSIQYGNLNSSEMQSLSLPSGKCVPCRFESKEVLTSRMSSKVQDVATKVRVSFDSTWYPVDEVSVHQEGSFLYELKPRIDQRTFLLVTVVLLESNIKQIILSSPYSIVNRTKEVIEVVCNDRSGHRQSSVIKIDPNETGYVPLDLACLYPLRIRPVSKLGFLWSNQIVDWHSLNKSPLQYLTCESTSTSWKHNLLVFARNLMDGSLQNDYPFLQLNILPTLQIENLLPYEINLRIIERSSGNDWRSSLSPGDSLPILHTDSKSFLLMGINVPDLDLQPVDLPIIYTPISSGQDVQTSALLTASDKQDVVKLILKYEKLPGTNYVSKVMIYPPYVIFNHTDLSIQVTSSSPNSIRYTIPSGSYSNDIKPYFYSFDESGRKNRAMISIDNGTSWSADIGFDTLGSSSQVEVRKTNESDVCLLGMSISESSGKFCLTKSVTFTPRFVFKNHLDCTVSLREFGSSKVLHLPSNELIPMMYFSNPQEIALLLSLPSSNNHWTSPFLAQNVGIVHLKAFEFDDDDNNMSTTLLRLCVTLEDATFFVTITKEDKAWPFRLKNCTSREICYEQKRPDPESVDSRFLQGSRSMKYALNPGEEANYSWDFPILKSKLLQVEVGKAIHDLDISSVGQLEPWHPTELDQKIRIHPEVKVDSLTSLVTFNEIDLSKPKLPSRTNSNVKGSIVEQKFKLVLQLKGFGISLIDKKYEEFAYATLKNFTFRFDDSKDLNTFGMSLGWLQIDNQMLDSVYPIALFPTMITQEVKQDDPQLLQLRFSVLKDSSFNILYIKYASLLLQELSLEVEDRLVLTLLQLLYPSSDVSKDSASLSKNAFADKFEIPDLDADVYRSNVFFETLHLQPTRLNISFETSYESDQPAVKSSNPTLDFMTGILISTLGNIHDAPVQLNSILLENARGTLSEMANRVASHYKQQVGYQIYKIAGRADFLGNPVGLFNNVASGVFDMFYEPYQGFLLQDSQSFGDSFARGTSSFMRKTIYGVSDSVSKITGTISKGLSTMTMDPKYQNSRRRFRSRNRPKEAVYGVTAGANSFYDSMSSGFKGLKKPFTDPKNNSAGKFLKGFGKGMLGLATKPAIGLLDMTSNVSEGIRNSTDVRTNPEIDKVRVPRYVEFGGLIVPFKPYESLGKYMLSCLDDGKYAFDEYLYHAEIQNVDILYISTKHFIITGSNYIVKIAVPVKQISGLRVSEHDLVCTLSNKSVRYLPLPASQEMRQNCINAAFTAYSEHYRLRLKQISPL
ncbi:intermembrane lipid transfer protein, chorein family Vps1302 [Schizosaccharomyces pombe]|uniref:lipid transfer protein n=1 Tax=Schizosaccharomyces pombe TaxID=4896 RepID=UPI0001B0628D|nr:vacuolar protein sorting-associated protein [Schizosaccharomyces pombe]CAA16910.2 chorein homolog (predicted) [Schizosaccharomyces pombe]|eukprot:NP_596800.2 vacuolar protein sorting-associated protein [Schizosaccharomyces pombe]